MKNGIFPNTAIDARAVTATQGGVAKEEPIPTRCHDSKYVRQRSVAPDGETGRAPPTIAPKRFLELMNEMITIAKKPITSGRLKTDSQLTLLIGVSKSSSSAESRIDAEIDVSSGNTLTRTISNKR